MCETQFPASATVNSNKLLSHFQPGTYSTYGVQYIITVVYYSQIMQFNSSEFTLFQVCDQHTGFFPAYHSRCSEQGISDVHTLFSDKLFHNTKFKISGTTINTTA